MLLAQMLCSSLPEAFFHRMEFIESESSFTQSEPHHIDRMKHDGKNHDIS